MEPTELGAATIITLSPFEEFFHLMVMVDVVESNLIIDELDTPEGCTQSVSGGVPVVVVSSLFTPLEAVRL